MRALLLLGLAVAALFVSLMLWTTHGHFVAPISDLYVVAQYARAMAEGHPFRYNPAEPPTTGSTSLLHTALLAAAHAAGARGEGLVAFAVAQGAVFLVASTLIAARLASRLSSPREGWLAGGLVALGGPVAWGFLYGSDIALAMLLALLLLDRWLACARGEGASGLAAAGALLALARPEGLPIGVLLGAASALVPTARNGWRERLLPWAGACTGVAVLVLQRWITGSWLATSVSEKALLPNYGLVETLGVSAKYGVDVLRGLLLGLYPSESPVGFSQGQAAFVFPPLGLLLVLLLAAHPPIPRLAVALRVWLATVAATFALVGPNVFMGIHFNRYLMWAFPGLLALAAAGLAVLTRLAARENAALERTLFRTGAGLMLLLGALSTVRFAAVYAQMAGETWRREIPMATWIRANLPAGVRIANAATSIEYLTGHRNLNLHGVTSAAFLGPGTRDREAGMFEALGRLPAAERPPWLLLTRSGLEASALFQALTAGPPVFETASLGDDLLLLPARWELLDRGEQPFAPETLSAIAGLAEVDRLDVCDAHDEATHSYEVDSRMGELLLAASVEIGDAGLPTGSAPLADGGRLVVGSESFPGPHASSAASWRSWFARATASSFARCPAGPPSWACSRGSSLRVDGQGPLDATLPAAGGWREHVLRVPAAFVRSASSRIVITGRYTSFHYWFYQ